MKAIITVGVSGSGKSTWAAAQSGFVVINRDDIRVEIFFNQNPNTQFSWNKWKWSNEKAVTELQKHRIESVAAIKSDLIISDTNLNKDRAMSLKSQLETLGYDVEFKFFHGKNAEKDIDIETCLKRDSGRHISVGFDIIHKQWKQMIDSWGDDIIQRYVPIRNLTPAVIFDIDGTLANHTGIRGPFEWNKVDKDEVRHHVAELFRMYDDSGYYMIIFSGRDEVCRGLTEQWLQDKLIPYDALYMRKEGDSRSDSIIKLELFDEHVRDKFNVRTVVDDRKRVVQLWHDLGMNVINVGHINEYF